MRYDRILNDRLIAERMQCIQVHVVVDGVVQKAAAYLTYRKRDNKAKGGF